jgi:sulfonate transport system substrate-binding protein
MKRAVARLIIAGSIGWLTLAGTKQASAQETPPPVIHIAGQGNPSGKPYGSAVIGVLRAKQYLEEEFKAQGVKIAWQFPRGTGPAINEALASGQLDFANYGGLPNIVGRGAGLQTKVLASYGNAPTYVVVRNGLDLHNIADLKGKKIAVSRGTVLELALDTLLKSAGLRIQDVQLFDLGSADQVSALTAGDVDAVIGTSDLLALPERGVGKVLFSAKGRSDPADIFGSFVVTASFAKKYPQTTQRVVNAFVRAAHFAAQESNRDELLGIWAQTGTPRSAVAADYQGDPLRDRLSPLLDGFYRAQIERGIAFAQQQKLIRRPIDMSQWLDASYLDKAIRQYGYGRDWTPKDAHGKPQV